VLVYSTCSIFKAEGEHQADDFLKRHAGAKRKRVLPSEVPGFDASAVNKDGDVRIWPWHLDGAQGCDAHFVARFVRTQ
jgi:16S rRNA C967 or C1407 C5-methylase (RsmB/RsmF family)